MRVGVLLSNQALSIGGGYSFQTEIVTSLLRYAHLSTHQFTILGSPEQIADLRSTATSQNITFDADSPQPSVPVGKRKERRTPSVLLDTGASPSGAGHKSKGRDGLASLLPFVVRAARTTLQPLVRAITQVWDQAILERRINGLALEICYCPYPLNVPLSVPYITTVWDLQHRIQPWFPEVSANGEWEARDENYTRCLRRATAIITGTETGKEEVTTLYQVPPQHVQVIPFPAPISNDHPDTYPENIREKYNIPDQFLFYPAQFWPHKNHANLLLALQTLRDVHGLALHLVLTGSDQGNLSHVQRLTVEYGLERQVHSLGFVPRRDLIELYRQAVALVFLTCFGPDNLPPLEAFALGCPVIASNIAGAGEQLGNAALLVDPQQPKEIALAFKRLYEEPSLREMLIARGKARTGLWTGKEYILEFFRICDEFAPIRRCWGS